MWKHFVDCQAQARAQYNDCCYKKSGPTPSIQGGGQNTAPQNMPLWHIAHFVLKALKKKQQIQEEHPDFPFFSLKARDETPM